MAESGERHYHHYVIIHEGVDMYSYTQVRVSQKSRTGFHPLLEGSPRKAYTRVSEPKGWVVDEHASLFILLRSQLPVRGTEFPANKRIHHRRNGFRAILWRKEKKIYICYTRVRHFNPYVGSTSASCRTKDVPHPIQWSGCTDADSAN